MQAARSDAHKRLVFVDILESIAIMLVLCCLSAWEPC